MLADATPAVIALPVTGNATDTATRRRAHLDYGHPLASFAAQRCRRLHGPLPRTACGQCWEQVIRADERIITEFDLDREADPDATYVDPVAVERACQGDAVKLTAPERVAAVSVLASRGLTRSKICQRLRMSGKAVAEILGKAERHVCSLPELCEEVRLSTCRYGCKVLRCGTCGSEQVVHLATYGCPLPLRNRPSIKDTRHER